MITQTLFWKPSSLHLPRRGSTDLMGRLLLKPTPAPDAHLGSIHLLPPFFPELSPSMEFNIQTPDKEAGGALPVSLLG